MVGLTSILRQAQTHVRWAADKPPTLNIRSKHTLEVLNGCHALPCITTPSLHATALPCMPVVSHATVAVNLFMRNL